MLAKRLAGKITLMISFMLIGIPYIMMGFGHLLGG